MKKLLAFVLVSMLVLSSVVPCFALTTAPAAKEGTVQFWWSDVDFKTEDSEVEMTYNVVNDSQGFWAATFVLIYPECFSIKTTPKLDSSGNPKYDTNGNPVMEDCVSFPDANFASSLKEACNITDASLDQYATVQYALDAFPEVQQDLCLEHDPDDFDDLDRYRFDGYKAHIHYYDFGDLDNNTNPAGVMQSMTFVYDPTLNPEGTTEFEFIVLWDATEGGLPVFAYNPDDLLNPEIERTFTVSVPTVTVPAQGPVECSHDNQSTDEKAATCTDGGYKKVTCDDCHEILVDETYDALNHDFTEFVETVPPTCTVNGYTTYKCTRCDETDDRNPVTAPGHTSYNKVITPSTTTTAGTYREYCTVCQQYVGEEQSLPTLDVFTAAIADATAVAGATVTVPVNVTLPATGFMGTSVAILVDKNIGAANVTVKDGDIFDEGANDAAVATDVAGLVAAVKEFSKIEVDTDKYELIANVITDTNEPPVNATGEGTLFSLEFTAPETAGTYSIGFAYASDIVGEVFADGVDYYTYTANNYNPMMTLTVTECAHESQSTDEKAATCTENGYKTVTCDDCHEVLVSETYLAPGHNTYNKVISPSTTTAAGIFREYCVVCKQFVGPEQNLPTLDVFTATIADAEVDIGETVSIPVSAVLPETGFMGTSVAILVDKNIGAANVTVKDGDIFGEGANDAAVATDVEGLVRAVKKYSGINVDTDKYELIANVITDTNEPPVNATGEGTLFTIEFTAPITPGTYSIGFAYASDIVGEVFANGIDFYTYTASDVNPMMELTVVCPHVNTSTDDVESTCTEAGHKIITCNDCHEEIYNEDYDLADHVPGEWEVKTPATVDNEGEEVKKCQNCGTELDSRPIDKIKVLDLAIEPGFFADAAQTTINNITRTITLVSKAGANENDFRILAPEGYNIFTEDESILTVVDNGNSYFRSSVKTGYTDSYILVVTDGDDDYEYTVNVEFVKAPACTGVEAGFFAESAGFDLENENVINVVAKTGAWEVDFRLLGIVPGTYPTFGENIVGDNYAVQWTGEAYERVEGDAIAQTEFTYFRTTKTDIGENIYASYTIMVVYPMGDAIEYEVHVYFPEA